VNADCCYCVCYETFYRVAVLLMHVSDSTMTADVLVVALSVLQLAAVPDADLLYGTYKHMI
jgi:hypothetical protein